MRITLRHLHELVQHNSTTCCRFFYELSDYRLCLLSVRHERYIARSWCSMECEVMLPARTNSTTPTDPARGNGKHRDVQNTGSKGSTPPPFAVHFRASCSEQLFISSPLQLNALVCCIHVSGVVYRGNTGCFIPNTPIKQRGASAGNPRDMGGVGPVETNEEKASIVTH